MGIAHSWSGDPHAEWALEGQPDAEPEPLPRMCRYCASYTLLEGTDDIGICWDEFGDWAYSWRAENPNAGWHRAAYAAAEWVVTYWTNEGDDACGNFKEEE